MAFSWSLFNWIADVACLAFAAYAAGGKPSLAGLTVAYAAARAVGSIPLMFRTETDVDPDAGLDEVDPSETVSDAEPKHDS